MKKDNKSLLWGILAGSVVGSVTALLFAPKPGKELRKDIADGTTEAIDKVQEIALQASDKSTELYSKAKEAVETVVTEVKGWSKQCSCTDEEEKLVTVSEIAAEEAEAGVEATDIVVDAADVVEEELQEGKCSGETV